MISISKIIGIIWKPRGPKLLSMLVYISHHIFILSLCLVITPVCLLLNSPTSAKHHFSLNIQAGSLSPFLMVKTHDHFFDFNPKPQGPQKVASWGLLGTISVQWKIMENNGLMLVHRIAGAPFERKRDKGVGRYRVLGDELEHQHQRFRSRISPRLDSFIWSTWAAEALKLA